MTEYQVTRWRELPSMVAARAGDDTVKTELAPRFQEAIDEAAMRLGDTGADEYLLGWERSPWTEAVGTPAEVLTGSSPSSTPSGLLTRSPGTSMRWASNRPAMMLGAEL